jgi:predicted DNA binding protein
VRVDDHERLTEFYRACSERGVGIELVSVRNPGVPREFTAGSGLTGTQRETLRIALENGYFDVPRRTNLGELADQLDVSDSAVSQRLRRGIETVLASVIAEHDGRPPEE